MGNLRGSHLTWFRGIGKIATKMIASVIHIFWRRVRGCRASSVSVWEFSVTVKPLSLPCRNISSKNTGCVQLVETTVASS